MRTPFLKPVSAGGPLCWRVRMPGACVQETRKMCPRNAQNVSKKRANRRIDPPGGLPQEVVFTHKTGPAGHNVKDFGRL